MAASSLVINEYTRRPGAHAPPFLPADPAGFFVGGESAEGATAHSLVKGCISPTLPQRPIPRGSAGAYGVIEFRDWQQAWRFRTSVETANAGHLSPPEGERFSHCLSDRAARTLADSCEYVGRCKGGYRTFLTLTFDDERRAAMAAGIESIQEHVSRFFDGLQRMWQRGWKAQFDQHGMRFFQAGRDGLPEGEAGHSSPLLYCWVIENPKNAEGEDNPHVHVMLNWRVKYRLFPAWARRVENLWGCGFAHLEKIRDAKAAGGYLLKALGYLTKGQNDAGQGVVKGNRYNMSQAARAPDWVRVCVADLFTMGVLIADVHQHVTETYGERYRRRRELKEQLDRTPPERRDARRLLGRQLERVRRQCEEIPVVASKYQILCKGPEAYRDVRSWMEARHHWPGSAVPWLPEKPRGQFWCSASRPTTRAAQGLRDARREIIWRRACRVAHAMAWTDDEWHASKGMYEQLAGLSEAIELERSSLDLCQ